MTQDFAQYRDTYRRNFGPLDWLRISVGRNHFPFRDGQYGSPLYWTTGYCVLWRTLRHLYQDAQASSLVRSLMADLLSAAGTLDAFSKSMTEGVERASDMFEGWRKDKVRYPE